MTKIDCLCRFFLFFWRGIKESYLASVHRTMTLKSGLEQQGQTILNFHFLTVMLMTGTLYLTLLCQPPV